MFKSDWGKYIAFGVAPILVIAGIYKRYICAGAIIVGILLSAGIGWASPPTGHKIDDKTSTQTEGPSPVSPIHYTAYPNVNEDGCYYSKDHDAADLCAQWRATFAAEKTARLAIWSNWTAAAGAILSFVSIMLVIAALRQTRKLFEAENRPWLKLVSKTPLENLYQSNDGDWWCINLSFDIINAGNRPASFIRVYELGVFDSIRENDLTEFQTMIDQRAFYESTPTRMIFQGDEEPVLIGPNLIPKEIDFPQFPISKDIVGVVEYRLGRKGTVFFTPFVWRVTVRQVVGFLNDGDIPVRNPINLPPT